MVSKNAVGSERTFEAGIEVSAPKRHRSDKKQQGNFSQVGKGGHKRDLGFTNSLFKPGTPKNAGVPKMPAQWTTVSEEGPLPTTWSIRRSGSRQQFQSPTGKVYRSLKQATCAALRGEGGRGEGE